MSKTKFVEIMNKTEHINYWLDAAEVDFKAMNNLFNSKDYVWSLFLGHLVIEKIIKAFAVKNDVRIIPKIHDLAKLSKRAKLYIDEEMLDTFDIITSFNIEARYPDYKKEFYKKCTKEFTFNYIKKIKEIRLWLLKQIER